jgi:hypothetical protein
MAKALSHNGVIFDTDRIGNLISEDQKEEMVNRYSKMNRTPLDTTLEFIEDLKAVAEHFKIGLINPTTFLETVSAATMSYLATKINGK